MENRQLFSAIGASSTEVLVQVGNAQALRTITHWISKHPAAALTRSVSLKHSKQLFAAGKTSMAQIRLQKDVNLKSALKALSKVPGVRWASPNYVYAKTKGEMTPNDPRLSAQQEHLDRIKATQAWDTTIGTGVTVAVIDDGVDIDHEDLVNNIWKNTGEIAGNGIDDDANGYIDDVNGWDFGSGDNNPRPVLNADYNFVDSHGTLVAGIIGASINNGLGIAGVAGGVKLMPIRFQGYGVTVTSAALAQSLAYAANNGAKVINISYSIDPYMNDLAFKAATDLAYQKGAIWINSAGNQNVANPPRLAIDKALFVSNTRNTDERYLDSNWGDGIDLAAPGEQVRGTIPGNGYQPGTGTSFSSAMTSGVAALIWAAHPDWTRDQVVAQLVGSVDNIDALNPTLVGQLGTGRINALKGVGAQIGAPTLRGLKGIADNATLTAVPDKLTLNLFNVLDSATVANGSFELRFAGSDGVFNENDTTISIALTGNYFYGTNQVNFTLPANLENGLYRFTAKSSIKDPFGQALDGNKDGTGGDDFVTTFTLNLPAPTGPTAPSDVSVVRSPNSDTEAEIRWTDNSANETGFIIERSLTSDFAVIEKTMTAGANSTRYNDWGLSQGNTYHYRVRATNALGNSAPSNVAVLAIPLPPPGIPNAPTNLTVTTPSYSDAEAEIRWTDSSNNETGFVIERSSTSDFAVIEKTMNAVANSAQYNDWGLSQGRTYYYRIRAVNGADSSVPSNVAVLQVALPPAGIPNAPATFTVTTPSYSNTEVELAWADSSSNETGFVIERSSSSSFASIDKTFTVAAGSTRYNDWGLTPGQVYYYRVKAINGADSSTWTNAAPYQTPGGVQTPPAAPSNLAGTPVSGSTSAVTITWTDNSPNETGFELVRSTSESFASNVVTISLGANVTSYVNEGLTPNTKYYYRILATGTAGNSAYSATLNFTTGAATMLAPSNVTATAVAGTSTSATIAWIDNSAEETSFEVIRSTSADFSANNVMVSVAANTTSFVSTNMTAGTTYYFRVRAYSTSAGGSAYSNTASYTPAVAPTAPAAPSGLAAAAVAGSTTSATITWTDNANNETGFQLERSTTATFTAGTTTTVTLGENVTTYASTGLAAGTTYYYRVRATGAAGESGYSNTATFTTAAAPTAPAAPSGLAAVAVAGSTTSATITWTDNANNETGFQLERSTTATFTAGTTTTVTLGANVTTYTSTGLAASTTYYYRVRATNAVGNSAYSPTATFATPAPVTIPSAPSTLAVAASTTSDTAVNLTWRDNSNNETKFELQRSTNNGFTANLVTLDIAANATSYADTGLTSGTRYYYRLRAVNSAGGSAYTSSVNITPQVRTPAAPSGFTGAAVAGSTTAIQLTWVDNSYNETRFEIQRSSNILFIGTTTINANADTTTLANTGLNRNTTYYYRIRAINSAGNSSYSSTISVRTNS